MKQFDTAADAIAHCRAYAGGPTPIVIAELADVLADLDRLGHEYDYTDDPSALDQAVRFEHIDGATGAYDVWDDAPGDDAWRFIVVLAR